MEVKLSDLRGAIDTIKSMKNKIKKLDKEIDTIASQSVVNMNNKFKTAIYDGVNDVTCSKTKIPNGYMVEASGDSVLFIEFGTGITYPNTHPDSNTFGMFRGSYGKGKGKLSEWYYYGNAGTNGEYVLTSPTKGDLYTTRGSPANMPVYLTSEEVKLSFSKLKGELKFDKH